MTHGFNLDDPLVCEGIIGDGCGGGRIFFVEGLKLFVFDPLTKEQMLLADLDEAVYTLSKEGCSLFLETKSNLLCFDLQSLAMKSSS